MPAVTIRNLPDATHRALKVRAAQHGRSAEAEMRDILETAVRPDTRLRLGSALAERSRRLGLTEQKDPEKIERDLIEQIPRKEWINFSHRLIHHGRRTCVARKPKCEVCVLADVCPRIGVAEA